jgi:hypothetical protein
MAATRQYAATLAFSLLMLWLREPLRIPLRQALIAWGLGAGQAIYSWCLYLSFEHLPVALAILAFYTYPLLTALLGWASGQQRPDRYVLLALLLAFAGLALALGGIGFPCGCLDHPGLADLAFENGFFAGALDGDASDGVLVEIEELSGAVVAGFAGDNGGDLILGLILQAVIDFVYAGQAFGAGIDFVSHGIEVAQLVNDLAGRFGRITFGRRGLGLVRLAHGDFEAGNRLVKSGGGQSGG